MQIRSYCCHFVPIFCIGETIFIHSFIHFWRWTLLLVKGKQLNVDQKRSPIDGINYLSLLCSGNNLILLKTQLRNWKRFFNNPTTNFTSMNLFFSLNTFPPGANQHFSVKGYSFQKQPFEGVLWKKLFGQFSENSQENIRRSVLF